MFKRAMTYARESAESARRRKKSANATGSALEIPRLDDFREEQNATRFVQRNRWLSLNVGAFPVRRLERVVPGGRRRTRRMRSHRFFDARADGGAGAVETRERRTGTIHQLSLSNRPGRANEIAIRARRERV